MLRIGLRFTIDGDTRFNPADVSTLINPIGGGRDVPTPALGPGRLA